MEAYLPMWTALHAGNAVIALIWCYMALRALADRAWIDFAISAGLAGLALTWLGSEAWTIASGELLPHTSLGPTVAAASWLGLAALVGLRRTIPGRSMGSIVPLALSVQGVPAAAFGFVASARGVLEQAAPARRWMGAALAMLLLSAGFQHERLAVRSLAGQFGYSIDERVMIAEWMVDASDVAAWAAAAMWTQRTRSAPPRDGSRSPAPADPLTANRERRVS